MLTIDDQIVKAATWIVCPMCDEKKCVGRFNCPEIKRFLEELKAKEGGDNAD